MSDVLSALLVPHQYLPLSKVRALYESSLALPGVIAMLPAASEEEERATVVGSSPTMSEYKALAPHSLEEDILPTVVALEFFERVENEGDLLNKGLQILPTEARLTGVEGRGGRFDAGVDTAFPIRPPANRGGYTHGSGNTDGRCCCCRGNGSGSWPLCILRWSLRLIACLSSSSSSSSSSPGGSSLPQTIRSLTSDRIFTADPKKM